MTIYPYTFASIDGASFPVGANNDGRLYQILANKMSNGSLRRLDFLNPVNTALNRQYSGTAILAGGRYFELINEQVTLTANTKNYITLNIDLSNASTPITISNESSNLSNTVDINGGSGILRICFEEVYTNASSVTSVTTYAETDNFQNITSTGNAKLNTATTTSITNSGNVKTNTFSAQSGSVTGALTVGSISSISDTNGWISLTLVNAGTAVLYYRIKNGVIYLNGQGNWGSFTAGQSKTVLTLPANLRPAYTSNVIMTTQNGGGQAPEVQIQNSGIVNIWSSVATSNRYGGFVLDYPL